MILQRNEALELASFLQILHISLDLKERKMEDALCEAEIQETDEGVRNFHLRKYLVDEMSMATNLYLVNLLQSYGFEISVVGSEPILLPCNCCGYHTIEKKGEYFICPVCYWEDDGISELNQFSVVNKMTLHEAIENFGIFGAISQKFVTYAYQDRLARYYK